MSNCSGSSSSDKEDDPPNSPMQLEQEPDNVSAKKNVLCLWCKVKQMGETDSRSCSVICGIYL